MMEGHPNTLNSRFSIHSPQPDADSCPALSSREGSTTPPSLFPPHCPVINRDFWWKTCVPLHSTNMECDTISASICQLAPFKPQRAGGSSTQCSMLSRIHQIQASPAHLCWLWAVTLHGTPSFAFPMPTNPLSEGPGALVLTSAEKKLSLPS